MELLEQSLISYQFLTEVNGFGSKHSDASRYTMRGILVTDEQTNGQVDSWIWISGCCDDARRWLVS